MKSTPNDTTCPRCGGLGGRCTICGAYYRSTALGCIGASCRAAAAACVCRCGRVYALPA